VIGNLEMEQLLSKMSKGLNNLAAPPIKEMTSVGFIQCVGSRNTLHLSYCSSVCCSATLKQIQQLKTLRPDVTCIVYYQDMRCPGFEEEIYEQIKNMDDVLFVRGFPKIINSPTDGTKITAVAEDTFSGQPVKTDHDLVVLAGGMQPSAAGNEFADISGLPLNSSKFFSGHYQCYPEDSQRTGILTGGCARGPMNVSQSIESANRAAMKALNLLEGSIFIDPTYPIVDKTKCDECKRCVEECPYACYGYDEKGFPEPDLSKCRQCGNCMGICPLGAISINHYTIKQVAAQVEVLENSFLEYDDPIVLAFLCENDAYLAAKSALDLGLNLPLNVIFMKVSCAGVVNNAVIADALALGVDGVLIAGCQDGQCHYVRGNELVRKRSGDLREKLTTMMIEPERVRSECIEIQDAERIVSILKSYIEDLETLGPNPFKI
jgi:heterodisulfide reductase subunit A/quinone-modifying oxidoreductase subunit QmoB